MIKAPIRAWRESAGPGVIAAIALVEFIFRGGYHAATVWRLLDEREYRWSWRQQIVGCLHEHVARDHGGHVPYLRRARDDGAPTVTKRAILAADDEDR